MRFLCDMGTGGGDRCNKLDVSTRARARASTVLVWLPILGAGLVQYYAVHSKQVLLTDFVTLIF